MVLGAVIQGNLRLESNEPRRLQLPKDFRFSGYRIGSKYGTGAMRHSVSAELAHAEGGFAGHGPNTPHLVVPARVLKQAETTERSKGETNELE
jgi:hypothetical protein